MKTILVQIITKHINQKDMLPKIFTILILSIISFFIYIGETKDEKIAMYCFYALGVIVSVNFGLLLREWFDSLHK